MERLSSCYFCGTAVDAPIEEYPVVPRDLEPDDEQQATVTLCPTCRRKLATVVEAVLDAAGSPVDAEAADVDTPVDAEQDAEADAGVGAMEAVEDRFDDDPLGAADAGDGADAGTVETGIDADSDEPGIGVAAADAGTDDDPVEAGADADLDDERDDGDGDDTAGGDDALDGLSVSAREYNRVMRLLGNREFPVDRSEFEMVASNAYDVSPGQVDAILDVAIDRGLIAEEDGRLVRTD